MQAEQPTKVCQLCNQQFEPKSKKATFCSNKCKQSAYRARSVKLDKRRKYRFATSAFVFFLADSCRRSGTIQVLPKTLSELENLHSLYKQSLRANAYGEDDQFSLCHIFPVKHSLYIGTMHADNLCISYRDLNSKHSNGIVSADAGHKISRLDLSAKWAVSEVEPKAEVVKRIVEYYGEQYTATIAVKLKLQPATRQANLDWLSQCGDDRVPSLADMEDMTTAALSKLKSEISGNAPGSAFLPIYGLNECEVFLSEIKRLSASRPELEQVIDPWLQALPNALELFDCLKWSRPKVGASEAEYQEALEPIAPLRTAQFKLLHGGNVEDFLSVLQDYIAESDNAESPVLPIAPKTRYDSNASLVGTPQEVFPDSTPLLDSASNDYPPMTQVIHKRLPLPWETPILQTPKQSFADELDAEDLPDTPLNTDDDDDDWSHLDIYLTTEITHDRPNRTIHPQEHWHSSTTIGSRASPY